MNLIEKTIEEKNVYDGKILNLKLQRVELPNGRITKREIVKHPGAVAIIAYIDEQTILLVEQFRKAVDKVLLEIPAGKIEIGEEIELCGRRELEEETGYKCEKFQFLGKIYTSPGFCDEVIYIYKAENLIKGNIGGDEDEFINLHKVKVDKIKEMIKKGEICDAKTISAFMYL
jgi:ADP-ribose pyrophosphatase